MLSHRLILVGPCSPPARMAEDWKPHSQSLFQPQDSGVTCSTALSLAFTEGSMGSPARS